MGRCLTTLASFLGLMHLITWGGCAFGLHPCFLRFLLHGQFAGASWACTLGPFLAQLWLLALMLALKPDTLGPFLGSLGAVPMGWLLHLMTLVVSSAVACMLPGVARCDFLGWIFHWHFLL